MIRSRPLLLALCLAPLPALAQTAAPATAATPAPAPAAAASAPRAAPATPQRVEVTGGRPNDEAERRQSTTTRIVVGRDELDKFGDATLGEVMRRLPGVTTPGPRGGAPRMRGLGGGYTQILIDGQRTPPGFSVDSINPEQVERIEILRAPTAETGTRAIGGTINIITREGFKRRVNELRAGAGFENGRASPAISWTRNESLGPGAYNLSASLYDGHRRDDTRTVTTLADGRTGEETSLSTGHRRSVNLNLRVQMPLNTEGDTLMLQPTLFHTENESRYRVAGTGSAVDYALAQAAPESRFTNFRLNSQWRKRLAEGAQLTLDAALGHWRSASASVREELDATGTSLGTLGSASSARQNSGNLTLKLSRPLGEERTLVAGVELETTQRRQTNETTDTRSANNSQAGSTTDDDGALQASSRRGAAYAQLESTLTPQWSVYGGLRWEGIWTEGELTDGSMPRNRSSVWTPLAHAVWKPDPKSRDQVRLALTRSYRSPDLGNLISLRSVSANNSEFRPDRAGNPELRPELATGLDVAWEHYLAEGGLVSANVFHRRITDLIRRVVSLETIGGTPRWVSRPQNIGDAWTEGVELEARVRLEQLWAGGPATDVRANASVFRSRVSTLSGPDNRLAEQPSGSLNLGADHRFKGTPFTLGGNLNWVPGYRTQLAENSWSVVDPKRVLDVYGLWTVNPDLSVRLLANNLLARDYTTTSLYSSSAGTDRYDNIDHVRPSFQLRLEFKL